MSFLSIQGLWSVNIVLEQQQPTRVLFVLLWEMHDNKQTEVDGGWVVNGEIRVISFRWCVWYGDAKSLTVKMCAAAVQDLVFSWIFIYLLHNSPAVVRLKFIW